MKVLLIKSVEDLGIGGDVVDVADGYARNFLLPRKLAIKATDAAVKSAEIYRAKALAEQIKVNSEAETLAEKIRGFQVQLTASADENGHLYGSITERHISDALSTAGFEIDTEHVLLSEHIKSTGEFPIQIKIYGDIRSEITVKIDPEESE
jgi:large subunit ribosomal protein L9